MPFKFNPFTGTFDKVLDGDLYALLDGSNQPFTGNLQISKADPTLTFTDTGDSNSATIARSDTSAVFQVLNKVSKPPPSSNALQFVTNDYVDLTDDIYNAHNTGTFSYWVYPTSAAATQNIFSGASSTIANNFISIDVFLVGGVLYGSVLSRISGGAGSRVRTTNQLTLNAWNHVVVSTNGSRWRIVQNGVDETLIVTSGSNNGQWFDDNVAGTMRYAFGIVHRSTGDIAPFQGKLDELAYWSDEKSVNDAIDMYNAGVGLHLDIANNFPTDGGSIATNISGLWHLDADQMNQAPGGKDVEDESGNGYHGTASGTMTDSSWVAGLISSGAAVDVQVNVLKSEDGTNPSEQGITCLGNDYGRSAIKGQSIRFQSIGLEIARFDATTKTFIVDNGYAASQQSIFRAAPSATQNITEWQDNLSNLLLYVEPDGELVLPQDSKGMYWGIGKDGSVIFNGSGLVVRSDEVTATDYLQLRGGTNGIDFNIGATEQMSLVDGIFQPTTTNDIDIGTSLLLIKDFWQIGKKYFRDSAIGQWSQADSYQDFFADGGMRFGDSSAGAPTNYANFAPDGELTLVGTARVTKELQLFPTDLSPGASGATLTNLGSYEGYAYTIGDDMIADFEIPHDWDSSTNIEIYIVWAIDEAYATNSGEVQWQITWAACPSDSTEAVDAPTHTGTIDYGDQNIPATAKYLTQSSGGIISSSSLSDQDLIGINISRIALDGGSNPTAEPIIFHIKIHYTSNKLGTAT